MDLLNEYVLGKRPEAVAGTTRTGLEWALLPTFSYNPVYGTGFGALVSGAGRRGSENAPYSSLAISGNISTTGQIQLQVRGDVFNPGENYLLKADFRYLDTERSTWGLGPVEAQEGEYPMTFVLNRFYMTALRHVSGPVYLGIGVHYDKFGDIVDERATTWSMRKAVTTSTGVIAIILRNGDPIRIGRSSGSRLACILICRRAAKT